MDHEIYIWLSNLEEKIKNLEEKIEELEELIENNKEEDDDEENDNEEEEMIKPRSKDKGFEKDKLINTR